MDSKTIGRFIDVKKCIKTGEYNFEQEANQFLSVLDSASKENDVQNYIKRNEKWFITASLLKDYDFGQHEAYLIPKQELGSEFRVDYMIVGKNSLGYQVVLVEFENVNVDYKLHLSNTETEAVRKGLTQIRDWDRWMETNKQYFLESSGLISLTRIIPSWCIHYCLVVSRRTRMDEISNQLRGHSQKNSNLHIVSYDRLVDNIRRLTNGI